MKTHTRALQKTLASLREAFSATKQSAHFKPFASSFLLAKTVLFNFTKKATLLTTALLVMLITSKDVSAQNGVGINTTSPQAALDVTSTSSGILIPRMTSAQRIAISSPPTASLVYQTDGTAGFYYYNGSAWLPLLNTTTGWNTTGNAGTTAGTNFIGTTDAQDFAINTNGTEKVRVLSNGNVGIGTTNAGGILTVASATTNEKFVMYGAGQDGSTYNRFSAYVDSNYHVLFEAPKPGNIAANRYDYWFSHRGDAKVNPRMVIKGSSGNVGIGTASPGYKLDVAGKISAFAENDANGWSILRANYGNGINDLIQALRMDAFGVTTAAIGFGSTDLSGNGGLRFWTRNSGTLGEVMRINNAGNVGIGTISPSSLLHLSSAATLTTMTLTNTVVPVEGSINVGSSGGLNRMVIGTSTAHDLAFGAGGATRMTVVGAGGNAGNVGIGTTTPGNKLVVNGGNTQIIGGSSYISTGGNTYIQADATLPVGYITGDTKTGTSATVGGTENFDFSTIYLTPYYPTKILVFVCLTADAANHGNYVGYATGDYYTTGNASIIYTSNAYASSAQPTVSLSVQGGSYTTRYLRVSLTANGAGGYSPSNYNVRVYYAAP